MKGRRRRRVNGGLYRMRGHRVDFTARIAAADDWKKAI
jgi:hypothetical protein